MQSNLVGETVPPVVSGAKLVDRNAEADFKIVELCVHGKFQVAVELILTRCIVVGVVELQGKVFILDKESILNERFLIVAAKSIVLTKELGKGGHGSQGSWQKGS